MTAGRYFETKYNQSVESPSKRSHSAFGSIIGFFLIVILIWWDKTLVREVVSRKTITDLFVKPSENSEPLVCLKINDPLTTYLVSAELVGQENNSELTNC